MKAIRKLRSQDGASLIFSLMLFLMCAVISSVVIVASSAVGGRASKLAQMDQRYYAVSSAAELIRDVVEEQTVMVTSGKQYTGVSIAQEGGSVDDSGVTEESPILKMLTVNGKTATESSFLAWAASTYSEQLHKSAEGLVLEEEGGESLLPGTPVTSEGAVEPLGMKTFALTAGTDDSLKVGAMALFQSDGKVKIVVYNDGEGIDVADRYMLSMTFDMDLSSRKENSINGDWVWDPVAKVYTRDTVKIEKDVDTYKWRMISIADGMDEAFIEKPS